MAVRKFRITVNGVVYDVEAEEIEGVKPQPVASVTASEKTVAPSAPPTVSRHVTESGVVVEAPLPGAVLDVRAAAGQIVEVGQIVVILEAMKMENEITAPVSGRISAIYVHKGGAVNAQDPLFAIES
ncbi:MAG: biotin/lipoyl-containing protein [Sulfobacillus sp.]